MVYVRKKDKETTLAMLRRFSRSVQQSGVLRQARKSNFYARPLNKRARKVRALRSIAARKARERLEKLGKVSSN